MSFHMIKVIKLSAIISVCLLGRPAHAILDFIGQTAKDAVQAAAYVDAAGDLVNEIDDSSAVGNAAKALGRRTDKLRSDVQEVYWAGDELKSILSGPDWSSQRLDQNIIYTTRYVQRIKRTLVRLGLVGTDVATAMNTAETNSALNEVLKNQQAQILLQREGRVDQMERELAHKREWELFIEREHRVRGHNE